MFMSHFRRLSLFSPYTIFLQCVSHYPRFSIFSPYTDPTVYISHFSRFSLFLAIFQVLPCEFLGFLVGHFSRHIQSPTVFVSHFPHFSGSRHIHILEFVCLIFLVFQFSRHIPCPTVCISLFFFHFLLHFVPYITSYSVCFAFP